MTKSSKKTPKIGIVCLTLILIGGVVPQIYSFFVSQNSASYQFSLKFMSLGCTICVIAFLIGIIGIILGDSMERSFCLGGLFLSIILYIQNYPPIGSSREVDRRISCKNYLKQIGISLKAYANDNNGYFPPNNGANGLDVLRAQGYLTDPKCFLCPSTNGDEGEEEKPLNEKTVSYIYIGGLTLNSNPDSAIVYDKPVNHENYGNVLYVNGKVEGVTGNPWTDNINK